jgi:hypothetical protein
MRCRCACSFRFFVCTIKPTSVYMP